MRHLTLFFILAIFVLPVFASAQADPKLQVPDTIDEAKQGVLNIGKKIVAAIPGVIKSIWENEVIPRWKAMWSWFEEEVWQKRIKPFLETFIDRGREFLGQEVEKRKPLIEQALEQEKQELKKDIENYSKDAGKGIWERFLGLFQ